MQPQKIKKYLDILKEYNFKDLFGVYIILIISFLLLIYTIKILIELIIHG